MKQIRNFLSYFIFSTIILINSLAFSEEKKDYKKKYKDKIEELEEYQIEIDMLFAEYCYFHDDPICFEEENKEKDTVNELDIVDEEKGEIYYTKKNANLRKEPDTKSQVLIVILKNKPIIVYEVASNNPDWFIVEYNNIRGYIYGELITKEKSTDWIVKKDKDEKNEETINGDETSEEDIVQNIIKNCNSGYSTNDSFNSKSTYKDYCSCYGYGVIEIVDDDEAEYYDKYEEFSKEFNEKENKLRIDCATKTGFLFDYSDQEWVQDEIIACKNDYDQDFEISKSKYNKWCSCYHGYWPNLFDEDEAEYYDKYEELSKEFLDKEKKLNIDCLKNL